MDGRRTVVLLLLLVGGQSLLASGSSLRQEVKALAGGSVALRYRIDLMRASKSAVPRFSLNKLTVILHIDPVFSWLYKMV
jgi:hypothetical protein